MKWCWCGWWFKITLNCNRIAFTDSYSISGRRTLTFLRNTHHITQHPIEFGYVLLWSAFRACISSTNTVFHPLNFMNKQTNFTFVHTQISLFVSMQLHELHQVIRTQVQLCISSIHVELCSTFFSSSFYPFIKCKAKAFIKIHAVYKIHHLNTDEISLDQIRKINIGTCAFEYEYVYKNTFVGIVWWEENVMHSKQRV